MNSALFVPPVTGPTFSKGSVMAEKKSDPSLLRTSLASVKRQFQAVWDSGIDNGAILIQQNKHEAGLPLDSSDIDWLFVQAGGYAAGFGKSHIHPDRDAEGRVIPIIPRKTSSGARWRSDKAVPSFGFDRWHQVIRLSAVEGAAKAAGNLLDALPKNVRLKLWDANPVGTLLPSCGHWALWSEAVFALAWKEIDGSLLKAKKVTPVRFDVPNTEPQPPHEDWFSMRDWYSTLDNFAAASVQAIDILQSWLGDVPKRETEAAADGIVKRLETLERQPKKQPKRLTKSEKVRKQRNDFSCKRRTKNSPETWNEIYHAYNKKFPNDKDASPATLRLSHDRNCQKCRTK
jgi:hypothetical protein